MTSGCFHQMEKLDVVRCKNCKLVFLNGISSSTLTKLLSDIPAIPNDIMEKQS